MADITYHHRDALDASKISKDKLSAELQKKYDAAEEAISKFLKAPLDKKLKDAAEHLSAKVGHEILDFVEKDLPNKDEKTKTVEPPKKEEAATEKGKATTEEKKETPEQKETPATEVKQNTKVEEKVVVAEKKESGGNAGSEKKAEEASKPKSSGSFFDVF